MPGCLRQRFRAPAVNPEVEPAGDMDIGETGVPEERFDLWTRGTFRDLRRALLRFEPQAAFLENRPARRRRKIDVIAIKATARFQHALRLEYIVIAIPLLEMHEDNCRIDHVD